MMEKKVEYAIVLQAEIVDAIYKGLLYILYWISGSVPLKKNNGGRYIIPM